MRTCKHVQANLIIPLHPPGLVIRRLIKVADERGEVNDGDGGKEEGKEI